MVLTVARLRENHGPKWLRKGWSWRWFPKLLRSTGGVTGDPDVTQSRDDAKDSQVVMGEASFDSDHELGGSREELPSEELAAQIVVNRSISASIPNVSHVSGPALSMSQTQHKV